MFGVEGREGDPQRVLQTVCRLWRANWRGKMKGEEGRGGEKWNYSTWESSRTKGGEGVKLRKRLWQCGRQVFFYTKLKEESELKVGEK